MKTGMNGSTGSVASRPISPPPQPHWNTMTTTP